MLATRFSQQSIEAVLGSGLGFIFSGHLGLCLRNDSEVKVLDLVLLA